LIPEYFTGNAKSIEVVAIDNTILFMISFLPDFTKRRGELSFSSKVYIIYFNNQGFESKATSFHNKILRKRE
jgi:hypothetical protein